MTADSAASGVPASLLVRSGRNGVYREDGIRVRNEAGWGLAPSLQPAGHKARAALPTLMVQQEVTGSPGESVVPSLSSAPTLIFGGGTKIVTISSWILFESIK